MTETALPRPSRIPPWAVPVGLFAALLVMLLGIVVLARNAGKSDVPPEPPAFQRPAGPEFGAYDVERNEGGALKITTGAGQQSVSLDLTLGANDRIWLLDPAEIADVKPPMVVNVIGIPNEVRNYTIHLLAFAPVNGGVNFEGPYIPLADGFAGSETTRDAAERPVVSAVLESFDGRNGVTKTSTGAGTLYLDPGAPVRILRQGKSTDIQPGDRIAFHLGADGKPDSSKGVLVLTGGAN